MHLFDLSHLGHRRVKCGQRRFAGIAELDLDKGDMVEPKADRIQKRAISKDISLAQGAAAASGSGDFDKPMRAPSSDEDARPGRARREWPGQSGPMGNLGMAVLRISGRKISLVVLRSQSSRPLRSKLGPSCKNDPPETIDALIEDKIAPSDWGKHLGASTSPLVNASTWALMLTGQGAGR